MSLKSILSTVTLFGGVITLGVEVVEKVADLMQEAEDTATEETTGEDKKSYVMAAIKAFIEEAGDSWDDLEDMISSFIDGAKSFYWSIVDLFDGDSDEDTDTETDEDEEGASDAEEAETSEDEAEA